MERVAVTERLIGIAFDFTALLFDFKLSDFS
jgi:hypothetical protein